MQVQRDLRFPVFQQKHLMHAQRDVSEACHRRVMITLLGSMLSQIPAEWIWTSCPIGFR